ncbi:MAG: adenylate/guanylate cyclase domain-containing protein [SAR324 cluster bacterium]|nr:adenylate/guanylate cyclase domain-containing protein [SAR324 cluster bacterium]
MSESKPRRKLAAILAADVVGFSRMMGENEDRTLHNLKICRAITDESIETYHGRVFGSAGDSVIAEFASPVDAIVAAVEFQKNLRDRNNEVAPEDQMQFRVGLNLGDVIVEGDNLYGDGVNVAARLEPLAEPGGICVSGKFHDEVRRKLDLGFVSSGPQEMKNIEEPVHTFMVEIGSSSKVLEAFAVPAPAEPTLQAAPERPATVEAKVPAIAVLPFTNMGGDPEQEYFADGITEDIITNLSLWRTFPVISRNSSFTYRGQSHNLKQVAQELGARYIVEGSVRKGGNRVRITAQLIDAEEDHHLWSEKWDRTLEDIFDVQDEVSEAIARRVSPSVTGHEQIRLTRKRPENLSAWEVYLQGLRSFHERQHTDHEDPGLAQARQHFERAVEMEPSHSDAHAYLGLTSMFELTQRITKDPEKTLDEIMAHGRKAETLNPENPLALLGIAKCYFFRGDHSTALDYAQRAVQFNPSFALSFYWQGLVQVHIGEYQQGESSILKAFELSPADPELMHFHGLLYFACLGQEKYEEALEAIDKALLRHPDVGHHLGFRAAVLGHLERDPEAKAALDRYLTLRPNLKVRDDYRRIFVPNSALADPIIEGLVKAGWEPEG